MVEHLKKGIGAWGQMVHVEKISARVACHVEIPNELSEKMKYALKCIGITRLYSHQAESVRASLAGKHVVVASMTSSGEISLLQSASTRSTVPEFVSVCSALAQDQLRALLAMTKDFDTSLDIGIYDGDTSQTDRIWLRDNARLLITNPDMLNMSILPFHGQFRRILSNLRFVVIDEAHTYKGAFGCHTALILRRLRRLCFHVYGSDPSFHFCTATSANPREHAMELANLPTMELIQNDGSPSGQKLFVLWNPPLCPKTDRRRIESEFFSRNLCGFAATNASELGIDVGHIDATLHLCFPGGIASLWEQAGRSRRREKPSLAVYVAFEGPLDQYIVKFPQKLFRSSIECCHVLEQHLVCAAVEHSLSFLHDEIYFGPGIKNAIMALKSKGYLIADPSKDSPNRIWSYIGHEKMPSHNVSIRAIETEKYKVIVKQKNEVLEEIEESKAFFQDIMRNTSALSRTNPILEVSCLFAEIAQHRLRCIVFCKTRKLCELVLCYMREILQETAPHLVQDRRKIESEFFSGNLCGVAATNALELGIDVGHIDVTLHLGFPGSITSLWQQAGRSGRREKPSLAVYVAFEGPLDQYFLKFPQKLFRSSIECCHVDPKNQQVHEQHLVCAAVEHSLSFLHNETYFGPRIKNAVMALKTKGYLIADPSRDSPNRIWSYIGHEKMPSHNVSIRAIETEKYKVIVKQKNEVLEEIEESKAFFQVYDSAVYMHQGKTYLVKELDISSKIALCQLADLKYYTKTYDYTDVHVIGGKIAVWIRVPQSIKAAVEIKNLSFRAGLHAADHALLNVIPLYIICNSSDLASECVNPHDSRHVPERILLYDQHPGGTGISAQVQPIFTELLTAALELLTSCRCSADTSRVFLMLRNLTSMSFPD
ncbi:hypothetical protein TEA_000713 [Camellia sinensis var. sinensis]|uniref:Helicase C-terminal domain-containing protein n=1 Tax=Camellia sinensis var. sinensis TaxID=542762 RepID=A0A4S4DT58_CAMSN|nr:hypothetical protein TEA_000713 [Camellia sinensis var. sinensis]